MAVYEYECQACGKRFEVTAPMSEHDRFKLQPPPCPACGKSDTRQLISTFACTTPAE